MADAIGYLIMVATDAGLDRVAAKLTKVRAGLLGREPLENGATGSGTEPGSLN